MKSMLRAPAVPLYSDTLCPGMVSLAPSPAHLQQLNDAIFLSQFTCAVIATLDPESVCASAARQLYDYKPYRMMVFRLSPDAGGKTLRYAPARGRREPAILPFTDLPVLFGGVSVPVIWEQSYRLELPDGLGCIEIWPNDSEYGYFTEFFRDNLAASFAMALNNAIEHARVKEMAMVDGLTGLFNRRSFDEMLNLEGRKEFLPLSLLLIDLDDFKQVNDRYGHQAGDHVLATFGRLLKDSFRGTDLVARYGGEEFAILLPKTSLQKGAQIARRLLRKLAVATFDCAGKSFRVTASIGVASVTKGERIDVRTLVELADKALYRAKEHGKNRVETSAGRVMPSKEPVCQRLAGLPCT